MSESGLYHVDQFSSPPTISLNPFSWNNRTNNLFIEAPAGVGFSYCATPAGCSHTDTSTAADNLAALVSFFAAYPEYAANAFWIAGESYAGVYVPSLAYAIINHNSNSSSLSSSSQINIKGIMVGNGCIGAEAGHCGNDPTGLNDYHDVLQWKGHGLISEPAYDAIMAACTWANEDAACNDALQAAANAIGDIDVYDLCVGGEWDGGRSPCAPFPHAVLTPPLSPPDSGTTRAPTRPSRAARLSALAACSRA